MIELNKIYTENALYTMQHRIPNNFVDLTVTSPPYDNLRKYKGFKFPFKHIARHLYRITKDGGVLIWVVNDQVIKGSETGTSFTQALFFKECGFRLHDTMIYQKENFIPLTHNRYEQAFEFMFVFSKGRPKTFNPILEATKTSGKKKNYSVAGSNTKEGGYRRRNETVATQKDKIHTNIFAYHTGQNKHKHPAPFPEKLARDHIFSWSNEGDVVYDPFSGSGTVPKECITMKRHFIASEISDTYAIESKKRILPLQQQPYLL